jgi:hypothetical protein
MNNQNPYSEMQTEPVTGSGLRFYDYVKLAVENLGFKTVLGYGKGTVGIADKLNSELIVQCIKYHPDINDPGNKAGEKFDLVIYADSFENATKDTISHTLGEFEVFSDNVIIIPQLVKKSSPIPDNDIAKDNKLSSSDWLDVLRVKYKFVSIYELDSASHALFLCSQHDLSNPSLKTIMSLQALVKKKDRRIKELRKKFEAPAPETAVKQHRIHPTIHTPSNECAILADCIMSQTPFDPAFLDSVVDVAPRSPYLERNRALVDHFVELEFEFGGKPRFLHVHAALIVAIRRKINLEWSVDQFRKLWDMKGEDLIRMLSLRWLVSATDTFSDYPRNSFEGAVSLTVSLFVNTIKLVETERYIEGAKPDLTPSHPTKGVLLFDGLSAFRVKQGDMLSNLLGRMEVLYESPYPCSKILKESVGRIINGPTTFSRIHRLKKVKTDLNI